MSSYLSIDRFIIILLHFTVYSLNFVLFWLFCIVFLFFLLVFVFGFPFFLSIIMYLRFTIDIKLHTNKFVSLSSRFLLGLFTLLNYYIDTHTYIHTSSRILYTYLRTYRTKRKRQKKIKNLTKQTERNT